MSLSILYPLTAIKYTSHLKSYLKTIQYLMPLYLRTPILSYKPPLVQRPITSRGQITRTLDGKLRFIPLPTASVLMAPVPHYKITKVALLLDTLTEIHPAMDNSYREAPLLFEFEPALQGQQSVFELRKDYEFLIGMIPQLCLDNPA